jgi:hypothetical protein
MDSDTIYTPDLYNNNPNAWAFWSGCKMNEARTWKPKLGTAGDLLYVRETAQLIKWMPNIVDGKEKKNGTGRFIYKADETESDWLDIPERLKPIMWNHCCSNGAFKELASIWFKITGVRAERVQGISDANCLKEGVAETCCNMPNHPDLAYKGVVAAGGSGMYATPQAAFRSIWNACYPGSWERNDHVFVYDIERCEKPKS